MAEERSCENCGVQKSLKEDFDHYGEVAQSVKKIELMVRYCVNCADNSHLYKHNWRKITKAQWRRAILKWAPKEAQKKLLAQLEKDSRQPREK
jgi:hypothetical protein